MYLPIPTHEKSIAVNNINNTESMAVSWPRRQTRIGLEKVHSIGRIGSLDFLLGLPPHHYSHGFPPMIKSVTFSMGKFKINPNAGSNCWAAVSMRKRLSAEMS
jgi:hypothetical protein